jgi:hypothetical protein
MFWFWSWQNYRVPAVPVPIQAPAPQHYTVIKVLKEKLCCYSQLPLQPNTGRDWLLLWGPAPAAHRGTQWQLFPLFFFHTFFLGGRGGRVM